MDQTILAVDDKGKFLEYIPKMVGHTGLGKRHLAITVVIYNSKNEILVQRRKHQVFNDIWDFSASTHPLHLDARDETLEEATKRALKEEYGISEIRVEEVGSFNYFAQKENLCENENDHVLVGLYDGKIRLNPGIAYEYKWVPQEELVSDVKQNPDKYTAWAKGSLEVLKKIDFFCDCC